MFVAQILKEWSRCVKVSKSHAGNLEKDGQRNHGGRKTTSVTIPKNDFCDYCTNAPLQWPSLKLTLLSTSLQSDFLFLKMASWFRLVVSCLDKFLPESRETIICIFTCCRKSLPGMPWKYWPIMAKKSFAFYFCALMPAMNEDSPCAALLQ